jgi:hypothetical protein
MKVLLKRKMGEKLFNIIFGDTQIRKCIREETAH